VDPELRYRIVEKQVAGEAAGFVCDDILDAQNI